MEVFKTNGIIIHKINIGNKIIENVNKIVNRKCLHSLIIIN